MVVIVGYGHYKDAQKARRIQYNYTLLLLFYKTKTYTNLDRLKELYKRS